MAVATKKKVVARKKATAPAARRKRKVTAREPKRIIRRKKVSTRKTAAKANGSREAAGKKRLADELGLTDKLNGYTAKGMSLNDAAEKAGVSIGKARRLVNKGKVGKDKIVGTPAEVAKAIVKARDVEGAGWPVIRARTGMGPTKIRSLYEQASGKKWRESGKPRATAGNGSVARGRKAKAVGRPKAKAATARGRRGRKTRTAKPTTKDSGGRKAGQPKGNRRAQRVADTKKRLEVIWDLDAQTDEVIDALEGTKIEVTRTLQGRTAKPTDHQVVTIKNVDLSDREGRVVRFIDENKQDRVISTREVTDLTVLR